ncbi:hypothetical protein QJS10_CPA08g00459 [Acorus calamus]|uniref:Uncharacterized protein n=1 Tax=Acorus calamus TaxID=4465 RepID=A0AAV9E7K3_ACOCL|nr:hypothetical protein QJS10_CPA08g00459 [Acorus calamus]
MEIKAAATKKGLISKTLERCRTTIMIRSPGRTKPYHRSTSTGGQLAPEGCCTVYVGPERERFVVKADHLNHPLFRMLLDEAETVYGFAVDGPLELPCEVKLFERVVWEVEMDYYEEGSNRGGCGFAKGAYGSAYPMLSPSRVALVNRI